MTLLLISLFAILTASCMATSETEVLSEISEANNAFSEAFKTVLEAQNMGGDVSVLLVRLNDAGQVLSESEMAYRNGDLEEAASKAVQSSSLANGVLNDALALKRSAFDDAQRMSIQTVLFSLVSALTFAGILIFAWSRLKHSYFVKALKMKPEVEPNAES